MLRVISEPADSPSKPEPEPKSRESAGRPQLTVMFCDLVGSTALWTRRPEDLPAVISTSQRCCYPAVAKSGGFVASYMGDSILAHFGYAHANEHDAERAVQSSLAVLAEVSELHAGPLCGCGQASPLAGSVISSVMRERRNKRVSARASTSPRGFRRRRSPTRIDCRTRHPRNELFECRALGSMSVKGFAGPIPVWQLMGAGAVDGGGKANSQARPHRDLRSVCGRICHRRP
jgi:class 3 adenylate cyclase